MERYERLISEVRHFISLTNTSVRAADSLDEKVEFQRTKRELDNALRILRAHYFVVEDAQKLMKEKRS